MRLIALLIAASCLAPTSAAAASGAPDPGTFLISELQVGYGFGAVFAEAPSGLAVKATIGAGGKPRGWPTRIYGVINVGVGFYGGAIAAQSGSIETERPWVSWSVGVRLLTPLDVNLRLLADISLGQACVTSRATVLDGAERYTVEDDALLVEIGLGLQYRVIRALSVGGRIEAAIPTNLDPYDLISELSGAASRDGGVVNPSFFLTATWHL